MFVKIKKNIKFNEKLKKEITRNIKQSLSPRHIPKKILLVNDIPKTKSGKIVELAVKSLINGKNIENKEILSNPECLNDYIDRKELKNLI